MCSGCLAIISFIGCHFKKDNIFVGIWIAEICQKKEDKAIYDKVLEQLKKYATNG